MDIYILICIYMYMLLSLSLYAVQDIYDTHSLFLSTGLHTECVRVLLDMDIYIYIYTYIHIYIYTYIYIDTNIHTNATHTLFLSTTRLHIQSVSKGTRAHCAHSDTHSLLRGYTYRVHVCISSL